MGGYRFAVIAASHEPDGLKSIDLGAGHSGSGESLCGRVVTALKSQALLNESVGADYIERNWPPVLKESGAWPLAGLRQNFQNGSLTRLLDPDTTLLGKRVEFVSKRDFGIAWGRKADAEYDRVLFREPVDLEVVTFEPGGLLVLKSKVRNLDARIQPSAGCTPRPETDVAASPVPAAPTFVPVVGPNATPKHKALPVTRTHRLSGDIPPETWKRHGKRILPNLRRGTDLRIGISLSVSVDGPLPQGP